MTSVSKKINKLVSNPESDLTAELEIPGFDTDADKAQNHEPETNVDTSEFSQSDIRAGFQELANAEQKTQSLARTGSLDRLQLDIEQLREEWAGLEQEISDRFDAEIRTLGDELQGARAELQERDDRLDSLQRELTQAQDAARRSADEFEQFRRETSDEAKEARTGIRDLEKRLAAAEKQASAVEEKLHEAEIRRQKANEQAATRGRRITELKRELSEANRSLADVRKQFDERQQTWKQIEEELGRLRTSLQESEVEVENLSGAVRKRDADLERGQSRIGELSKQLDAQSEENKKLKAENRELHRVARNDVAQELARSHKLIADQAGRLTGYEQEIGALTAQIERTERYADELRQQLREQSDIAETAVSDRQEIVVARDTAQDRVSELTEELTALRQQNMSLSADVGKLQKEHEAEVRRIRFELGEAQETIADQETINVQLTSDLFSTKGSQKGLETQLEETRAKYEERIQSLEQQANKLRNQLDDYEYKLENKDEAITALMNELSNRSAAKESVEEIEDVISEIEKVIDEIDDRIPTTTEEQVHADRERVTRLLVGENEGQELRFPLFKDRLTIGRTAHNDIQLDTQFISRQHAVIVTENGITKIVDWGSKNGILVNEERVSEQVLENGDIVTIGTTDFRYEERPKR